MALSQEAAVRRVIEQASSVLREMAEGFESLGDSVGRYPAPPTDGRGSGLAVYTAEFLTDPAEIVEALLDADAVATNQILGMFPGPVAKSAELAEEVERTGYVRSRGVSVRSIYAESFFKSPSGAKHLRELTELGVEIRILGSVPFRLIVSDTVTMMSGPKQDDAPSLAVLRPEFLARAARQALEYWWLTATPLEDLVRDLDNGPTPQERAILRLMLAGVRDEAIAREIGVSIRTFRRNLATLMNKLGTENRFQAGVKASAKGWL
ncbi:LuxR C-terminal-related transcriptional regulator [Streptomyces sp. NPDC048723]|uniref:helix-turn-helix transcriptional regulator n=1 Tax=unclassified Streptomyces TaxID=2593676 RepID=UPI0035661F88